MTRDIANPRPVHPLDPVAPEEPVALKGSNRFMCITDMDLGVHIEYVPNVLDKPSTWDLVDRVPLEEPYRNYDRAA